VIAAATLILAIAQRGSFTPTALDITVAMGIVVIAGTWSLACTADRVRHHAYALALFEAMEPLVPPMRTRQRQK
jgi:hypothetical protein